MQLAALLVANLRIDHLLEKQAGFTGPQSELRTVQNLEEETRDQRSRERAQVIKGLNTKPSTGHPV